VTNAIFTPLLFDPFRHTKKAAIPISTYRIVQTEPKTESGGVNAGFSMVTYHVRIDFNVKIEPMTPATKQTAILVTSLTRSLFSTFSMIFE